MESGVDPLFSEEMRTVARQMLDVSRRELQTAEDNLRALRAEVNRLMARVALLRHQMRVAEEMLGEPSVPAPDMLDLDQHEAASLVESETEDARRRRKAANQARLAAVQRRTEALGAELETQVTITADAEVDTAPLPAPRGLARPTANPNGSPYRVGLILREAGRPLTMQEIFDRYEASGWVKEDWVNPLGNVQQATRRAEKYGWARRTEDRKSYVYAPLEQPGADDAAGDNAGPNARGGEP